MTLKQYGIKYKRKAEFIELPFQINGFRRIRNTRDNIQRLTQHLGSPQDFRLFKQRYEDRIVNVVNGMAEIRGIANRLPVNYRGDMNPQTLTIGPLNVYKEKGDTGEVQLVDADVYITKRIIGNPTKELGKQLIREFEREYDNAYRHWAVPVDYQGNPAEKEPGDVIVPAVIRKNQARRFGKLLVRDSSAPYIAQYGTLGWNTTKDGCYLDWGHIETGRSYDYLKEKLGDKCDVDKLARFFNNEGHPIAFFGPDHRLQIKETRPAGANHHKQLVSAVFNNNHPYPIKNPDLLKHIAHMKVGDFLFLSKVDKFDGLPNQKVIKEASLHKTIVQRYEEKKEMPHALRIYKGSVVACQYGEEQLYADPNVDMIKETLARIKPMVPRSVRKNYDYRGQTPGSLAMDLLSDLQITKIQYRKSELSTTAPFDAPYVLRTINCCWNEDMPYWAFDIDLCFTSCVYQRTHDYPLYLVFDEEEPFEPKYDEDGELWIRPGRYYIKGSVEFLADKIDIGRRWMDSQLVEGLLRERLIKKKQITRQFLPSLLLPSSYFIDLVDFLHECKVSKDFRKNVINHMIGAMGQLNQKAYNGYITNSHEMLLEGYNSVAINDNISLNYQVKETRLFQTHRPIWQAVIDMSYLKVLNLIKRTVGPNTIVHAIKTDAIFLTNPLPVKPDKGYHPGHIHKEKPKQFPLMSYPEVDICYEDQWIGTVVERDFIHIKSTDLSLLEEEIKFGNSFLISGEPGVGKSYSISKIVQFLENYMATALSHKAVGRLKAVLDNAMVIARLFPEKTARPKIIKKAMEHDWLIVDEFSMVNKQTWSFISELHQLGQKFIFAGDMEQLLSPEKNPVNPLKHNFFPARKLFLLDWHDKCRCDPKLRNELQKLLRGEMPDLQVAKPGQQFKTRLAFLNKTVDYLNSQYENPTRFISSENNQAIYNSELFEKKGDAYHSLDRPDRPPLTKKDGLNVGHSYTIHRAQSSTIDEDFCIHNVSKLSLRLLYTAVSRGKKWENVYLATPLTFVPRRKPYEYKKLRKLGDDMETGYVYALFKNDEPIYIGSTIQKELENRKEAHKQNHPDATFEVQYVVRYDDEVELRRREYKLLRKAFSPSLINKVGTKELKEKAEQELQRNRMRKVVNLERSKNEIPVIRETKNEIIIGWKCPRTNKKQSKRFKIGKSIDKARKKAEDYIKTIKII